MDQSTLLLCWNSKFANDLIGKQNHLAAWGLTTVPKNQGIGDDEILSFDTLLLRQRTF